MIAKHRAEVVERMERLGLDPREFAWTSDLSPTTLDLRRQAAGFTRLSQVPMVDILTHSSSGSRFVFDEFDGARWSVMEPAEEPSHRRVRAESWNEQLDHLSRWLLLVVSESGRHVPCPHCSGTNYDPERAVCRDCGYVGYGVSRIGVKPSGRAVRKAAPGSRRPRDPSRRSTTAAPRDHWDLFISHASEDKDSFARPLATALHARGVSVWFDESTLRLGDSLRRSIDGGLSRCSFGVVVLSKSFFAKEWPQKELDGLTARESDGRKVILPVWHGVTAADVRAFSPMLADRVGISTRRGIDSVVAAIVEVVSSPGPNRSGSRTQHRSDAPTVAPFAKRSAHLRKQAPSLRHLDGATANRDTLLISHGERPRVALGQPDKGDLMWTKSKVIDQLKVLRLNPEEVLADRSISWGRDRDGGVKGEPRGWVHVKGEGGRWPSPFVRLIIASSWKPDAIGSGTWEDISCSSRIVTVKTWRLDHVPADHFDRFIEVLKRLRERPVESHQLTPPTT